MASISAPASASVSLVLAVLAACGSGTGSRADAAPGTDGLPGGADAGAVDAPAVDAGWIKHGSVGVFEMGYAWSDVGASFYYGGLVTTAGCDHRVSHAQTSAGVITFSNLNLEVTLRPHGTAPDLMYGGWFDDPDDDGQPQPDLFADDATIGVSAEGGEVPAFSGVMTPPPRLVGFVPLTELSRATPPTLTWTPSSSGTVVSIHIVAITPGPGNNFYDMRCRVPDDGSFSVPAEAYALIPSSATSAEVLVWRSNVTPLTAGDWEIDLHVSYGVATGTIPIVP
jgi:hypothetical protein